MRQLIPSVVSLSSFDELRGPLADEKVNPSNLIDGGCLGFNVYLRLEEDNINLDEALENKHPEHR